MQKLRVLMCSEASFLSSGFAIYAKEILSRLHSTGKYEIAEFASYGQVNDPRDFQIAWRYYANAVPEKDPRHKEYMSRTDNQFGRWRFEKVLLDFKPDVVIDVRDYWMSAYQGLSPLRKYFHWILMPTVDSSPQQESWLDTYLKADAIFTYSDWGAEVLNKQTSNAVKYIDTVAPGVDLEVFKPYNKDQKLKVREAIGIDKDAIIIGSVMRNQKRKLIPELFVAFRKYLDKCIVENETLAKNTFLHLHTSYPDIGWDLPNLLKEYRLSNKVLFSYFCKKCKSILSRRFGGPSVVCSKCGEKTCQFPSVSSGVSSQQLSAVYNCFDVYVQYAICEGAGMPQIEAASCGLPIFTVEYSAMIDIIKKLDAIPIKVKHAFRELETKAIRVYPDNDDLVNKLLNYISTTEEEKLTKSQNVRKLAEKEYNWDNIAKKWENYLDKVDSSGYRSKWDSPLNTLTPISNIDAGRWNNSYIDMLMHTCNNNLQNFDMASSMLFLDMLRDMDYGFSQNGMTIQSYGINDGLGLLKTYIDNNNNTEKVRAQNMKFNDDFIEYSHIKAST